MSLRHVLLSAVLAASLAACGDDDAEDTPTPETDAGSITINLGFDQPPTDDAVDAATSVIERRLEQLGVTGGTVERSGEELSVAYPPTGAASPATVAGVLGARGELAVHSVLDSVPPDGAQRCDGPLTPEHDEAGQLVLCYEVGPPSLDGTALADASAEASDLGGWRIALELRPGAEGLDPFNEIAAECFSRTAACPTGQIAIVMDGELLSAPSVQQPAFDARSVSISSGFTEAEARELAVVLGSGALPEGLIVLGIEGPG